ncbi:dynein heavy chain 12, axonemal isoform X1 [Oryzias melastigma]|uniref:dynein heavy chain 12, axonemal isoform X1 n=1 Tax=Oryzias melastigma TaxID=30732 RepID=UPI000CF7EAB5|nr:dynein heavy chain 12, axonemal isoform X1 [Oryzias melastigma]
MEFDQFGLEEDEDAATQFMIEQSLLEIGKLRGTCRETSDDSIDLISKSIQKIFLAIRQGNEKLLKDQSIKQRDRFLQTDSRGWTPLHEAAAQTNQTILELTFRASGPDCLERRTSGGQTVLCVAVEEGLMENAAFLLQQGAQPDCLDQDQDSPLFTAIRLGRADLVKLLLSRGSSVNREGCHGRRPLHEAAKLGNLGLVELLLGAGAQPDPRSHYGLTPLALAAQGGHREVVEALLLKGADVFSQAKDESSILYEASSSGDPGVIRLLLDRGADANVPIHSGHMPIHRISHRGHLQALRMIIPATSMADVSDSGISPLHSAAAGGHTDCIKTLLDAGYDPNYMLHPQIRRSYDDERKSALFFAVSNNDTASVQLLLEAGAMPNQDPIKCLQVALRLGNYDLIKMLLSYGANVNYFCRVNTTHFPSALQYAFKDEVILRMLCSYGYDVERCFDCPYGDGSHIPEDYEGWSSTVIKDTMFCEVITVCWLKHLSGHVVRILLDYVDHVTLCSKMKAVLSEQREWPDICRLQGQLWCRTSKLPVKVFDENLTSARCLSENPRALQHLCRLQIRRRLGRLRLRSFTFMSFLPLPQRLKDYILYREYELGAPQRSALG